jgi:exopolysaccharide biosynthesis polyprenyl glycosylphosphotransferase
MNATPALSTAFAPRGRFRERILIIGRTPLAHEITQQLESRVRSRQVVVGIVDDPSAAAIGPVHCDFLGPLSDLSRIVDAVQPDRVLIALGERRRRTPVPVLVESCVARGILVEDASEFYERITGQLAIESLTPTSLVFSRRFGPSRVQQRLSRTISLLVAIGGLVLLAPLLALIALAVKLESSGPVLFVHTRVGLHGRSFKLLKFRTMYTATSPRSEWERDNRDRVTRVGRFLRAFRLDELPQFVNVIRGEMNLVGPRPHPASNYELFTLVARNMNELTGGPIGYYTLRSMVRPGITGWAQVRYRYANDLEEEIEKLRYDLYYVKHVSPAMDLRIVFETILVMVKGHPAVGGRRSRQEAERPAAVPLTAPVNRTQAA